MKRSNSTNLIALSIVFLLFVLGCSNLNKNTTIAPTANNANTANGNASVAQTPSSKSSAAASATPNAQTESAGVTQANFAKIKTGMKYDEVVKILGKEGELLSENEIGGSKTVMYKWDGDEGFGSNMNAMFQNGKLVSKSQFGLK